MMVSVPPAAWPRAAVSRAEQVAAVLNNLAGRVPVHRMFRCRRGPKTPTPKRNRGNRVHHASDKKLLDRARGARKPKSRSPAGARK